MGQLRRRHLLILAGVLLCAPLAARAQRAPRRILYFSIRSLESEAERETVSRFREGLREHGLVEGRDYTFQHVWEEKVDEVPARMREALQSAPDLVVAMTTPVALAAARASREVPILFGVVSDPVASGLVESLARPGGNVTGVTNVLPELSGKLLELTTELVPVASRIAVMWNPANPAKELELRTLQAAAKGTSMALELFPVRSAAGIEQAFAEISGRNASAMIVLAETLTHVQRGRIAELARKSGLPSIFNHSPHVEAGGLAAYSPDYSYQQRRLGVLAAKIIGGARPSALPVEQPTKFELVINLKTAKALRLTIPSSLLLRADRVIE